MRRHLLTALAALALGLTAGALAAGCGSSTKTVSATTPLANAPAAGATTSRSTPDTGASTTATSSTPGTTRTSSEPAFTKEQASGEGAGAAAAVVRSKGYTPNDTAEYHGDQTLRVLVATRTGSGDGYGQQAFFFVNGRYIGTDTKEPSAKVRVLSQSDTEVTLAYPLYRKGDPLSTPSGGRATVRFQLNNGKLMALGPIPPTNSSTGLSRY